MPAYFALLTNDIERFVGDSMQLLSGDRCLLRTYTYARQRIGRARFHVCSDSASAGGILRSWHSALHHGHSGISTGGKHSSKFLPSFTIGRSTLKLPNCSNLSSISLTKPSVPPKPLPH